MRVIVTGHLGYLGSVLTPLLAEAGHEVIGLDVGYFAPCTIGPAPAEVPNIGIDLRDVTPDAFADVHPDAVIHLGALCNDPLGNLNPSLTYDVNHLATVRRGRGRQGERGARGSCSPRRAASTASAPTSAPLDETADFAPITPYGESKILSERDLAALADDDFSPVYLRNATAYGFSPRLRGDLVVNDLVAHALLTGEVRLLSDGKAWRPLVHAEDIAAAFLALLEVPRERVHNRAYNVGQTSENYLIRDVAELVHEQVGGTVTFAEGAGTDARNYRVTCDLIAAEVPEFRPQWTVAKGIAQLVENYQRYGLTIDALTGPQHQRLKRIRELMDAGRLDGDLRWIA